MKQPTEADGGKELVEIFGTHFIGDVLDLSGLHVVSGSYNLFSWTSHRLTSTCSGQASVCSRVSADRTEMLLANILTARARALSRNRWMAKITI